MRLVEASGSTAGKRRARRQRAFQHDGRVEVGEGSGRRRIGVVVGGHEDRLHRGYRALFRRGDALLKLPHLLGQVRLIAHRGRHAAQQRRDFRAGLREAEDVVDEEQHVAVLDIAEVLRDREAGQRHAQARARRLVHLAEDHRQLIEHARGGHFLVEVVAFARSLAHPGKDRETSGAGVALSASAGHGLLGDVVDQLLNDDRLAGAGAAEGADLAAAHEGSDQVDDLDAGLQHLGLGGLVFQGGCRTVNGQARRVDRRGLVVDWLAQHVEDAAQRLWADRHGDRTASVIGRLAAAACRRSDPCQRNARRCCRATARPRAPAAPASRRERHLDGIVDIGQLIRRELDVHHVAQHLGNDTLGAGGSGCHVFISFVPLALIQLPIRRRFPESGS